MRGVPDITLEEAQRRFIHTLKERKYPIIQRWTWDSGIYSAPLNSIPDVRAVMWREGKKWAASLSLKVGERGEFILAGGLIGRVKKQNWKLMTITNFVPYLATVRETLYRWNYQRDRYLNVLAMSKFAHTYTRIPGSRLFIERILSGIESGVTSEATAAEALSIVQYLYCRTRLDKVTACEIWWEVFR